MSSNTHIDDRDCSLGRGSLSEILSYILSSIRIIRAVWRSIGNIRKGLHGKRSRLLDDLCPAVLTLRVVSVGRMSPFDIGGIVRFAQRLHPHAIALASAHAVYGKGVPFRGSAAGLVVAAAAAHVVAADKAGFYAVEEWFEIEETGGADT